MPNGFSVERMLELILENQEKMDVKIDVIQRELSSVNANGCAQAPNYKARITVLEKWKETTTKSFVGLLVAAVSALAAAMYNIFSKN